MFFFNLFPDNSANTAYPNDPEALRGMRKNVAMELLWVQQAIDSRKNVNINKYIFTGFFLISNFKSDLIQHAS